MVKLNITAGDFCDRYTIVDLKFKKGKLKKLIRDYYEEVYEKFLRDNVNCNGGPFVIAFIKNMETLAETNSKLWDTEDLIRSANRSEDIAGYAEHIIYLNDTRASIKREIDLMFEDTPDAKVYSGPRSYNI